MDAPSPAEQTQATALSVMHERKDLALAVSIANTPGAGLNPRFVQRCAAGPDLVVEAAEITSEAQATSDQPPRAVQGYVCEPMN